MGIIPFLTACDPPGSSEGTLDPLGLYQIADRLIKYKVLGTDGKDLGVDTDSLNAALNKAP